MKSSISKILLIILITIIYTSCAKKIVSESNQSERFIEGIIVDSDGFEVHNAKIYFPEIDVIRYTDENGYFKIILPNNYQVKYLMIIDKLKDANTKFSLEVNENQMNYLKLDDFYRITKSIFDPPERFWGLPRSQDVVKFKVVYEYIYDAPFHLDESWSEDNGKPVPNATIQIQGTENIYKANENGEIWIEENKINIGEVIIIEDEMGSQSQVRITDKILEDKVIPYNLLIHID